MDAHCRAAFVTPAPSCEHYQHYQQAAAATNTTALATTAPPAAAATAAKATSSSSSTSDSPFDRWDYDPAGVVKESGQHVGLQNQVEAQYYYNYQLAVLLVTTQRYEVY
jgi:hypothetical protein